MPDHERVEYAPARATDAHARLYRHALPFGEGERRQKAPTVTLGVRRETPGMSAGPRAEDPDRSELAHGHTEEADLRTRRGVPAARERGERHRSALERGVVQCRRRARRARSGLSALDREGQ